MKSDQTTTPKAYQPGVAAAATRLAFESAPERPGQLSCISDALKLPVPGRRRAKRPAIRLTDRHYATVELVAQARALRTDQIQTALYPLGPNSSSACRRCLTKLLRHGYLDRLPRPSVNEPAIYVLSRRSVAGNRLLRERWGEAELRRQMSRLGSLDHLLAVNDLRVRILRATQELGWQLRLWQRSEELAPLLKEADLVPDAYFQIERTVDGQPRTAAFFLELERAGKSSRVLRSKLQRYGELYYGGTYERLFARRALRVLFVFAPSRASPTFRRVQAGLAQARSLGITIARFAGLDQLKGLPPVACLTSPLWYSPVQDEPIPLFEA